MEKDQCLRGQYVHPKPFLTPHLKRPKDNATKRGKTRRGVGTPTGRTVTEISVPGHRHTLHVYKYIQRIIADLISDETHTSVAFEGNKSD